MPDEHAHDDLMSPLTTGPAQLLVRAIYELATAPGRDPLAALVALAVCYRVIATDLDADVEASFAQVVDATGRDDTLSTLQ